MKNHAKVLLFYDIRKHFGKKVSEGRWTEARGERLKDLINNIRCTEQSRLERKRQKNFCWDFLLEAGQNACWGCRTKIFCLSLLHHSTVQIVMKQLFFLISCCAFVLLSCTSHPTVHRENGWYLAASADMDSIALEPIATVRDFNELRLDSDAFGRYVITGRISPHKQADWADQTEKASAVTWHLCSTIRSFAVRRFMRG